MHKKLNALKNRVEKLNSIDPKIIKVNTVIIVNGKPFLVEKVSDMAIYLRDTNDVSVAISTDTNSVQNVYSIGDFWYEQKKYSLPERWKKYVVR